TSPLSPYAVSKLSEETLTIAFNSTYDLDTTALRYFNVFGPRQRGGSYAGVINIFIAKAFENEALPIEGDGEQSRDFTYIEDVVDCNIQAAESSKSGGNIYNVGGGGRITINNLADEDEATTTFLTSALLQPSSNVTVPIALTSMVKIGAFTDIGTLTLAAS
ncbi:unnamed protein product, partial [marine sediment metagenome]